jgi:hypothetical protein
MPTISQFYGITIRMYFRDHPPPHFHAAYGDTEAVVDIRSLSIREGVLPRRAAALVLEWTKLHQAELLHAWQQVSQHNAPGQIAPLD